MTTISGIIIALFLCAAASVAAQILMIIVLNNDQNIDKVVKQYLLRHNIFNKRK